MIPENFANALLDSAKLDEPPAGLKSRAMANMEHTLAGSIVTASSAIVTLKAAVAAAAVAGAIGVGGGYELGRATAPAPSSSAPSVIAPEPRVADGSPAVAAARAAASPVVAVDTPRDSAAVADVCRSDSEPSAAKCSNDTNSQTVTFAVTSHCTEATLDLFWVDTSCHEIFRGMMAPGATLWQDSWDTHVFRLRDHATHRLVKEFVPTRTDGARDRTTYWKGPRTELPAVVIHETDAPIAESAPVECTRGGGRAAMLHVKNERKTGPIALVEVDTDCREGGWGRPARIIQPGETVDRPTSEGHAFRVRDASGALLLDIPPTMLDTTTYITVP